MRDLRLLVPFAQVARSGSFAAAAAALDVTPAAISKAVSRLERDLRVRLFNRTTRSLELTEEGRSFHAEVTSLLGSLDSAAAALTRRSREPEGPVRVSVTATFGRHCLMPLLPRFITRHPAVELELSLDESLRSFADQGVDVRIHHESTRATSHVSRVLCDYPIVLVASPEYLRAHGTPRTPAQLADHRCIGIRLPSGRASWHLFRRRTRAPRSARGGADFVHRPNGALTVATQLDASLLACIAGVGIAPCSVPAILPHLEAGELRVVLPDHRLWGSERSVSRVYVEYPHREHLTARVRAFVDFTTESFGSRDYAGLDLSAFAA